jgi:hypothetical protein
MTHVTRDRFAAKLSDSDVEDDARDKLFTQKEKHTRKADSPYKKLKEDIRQRQQGATSKW